jgi:hypothetical protein
MAIPGFVQSAAASWSSYYGNHQLLSVTIKYLHIAATMIGGGLAISLDRQLFKARRASDGRAFVLQQMHGSHRTVVPALAVASLTGVLMMGADLDTFLMSKLFWLKIGVVVALVANGAALQVFEHSAARQHDAAWPRLSVVSIISITLWLITAFVGTLLTVAA